MKLAEARKLARETANECNKTTYIWMDSNKAEEDYDVSFVVPSFGIQKGDPFEPVVKYRPAETGLILAGGGPKDGHLEAAE